MKRQGSVMAHAYSLALESVFERLVSSVQGLSEVEARRRIRLHGYNRLPEQKVRSRLFVLLAQFKSPLIGIVMVLVVVSLLLGHYLDAGFIAFVILVNTVVGFFQEDKANRSLQQLKGALTFKARVLRGGAMKEVSSDHLVPGDVLVLRPGDKVMADARLFEVSNLKVNESSLTGESLAVLKQLGELPEKTQVGDRYNTVFMGTTVEEGEGRAVVTHTASETVFGHIALLLKEAGEERTPLQRKLLRFSYVIGAFIIGVIVLLSLLGILRGESFVDVFLSAVALTVSAIPAGLLPIITIILALGMRRILKERGLVRKLIATETLGSITTICTDKTGTLTQGQMRVSHIVTTQQELFADAQNFPKNVNFNSVESHITALKIAALATEAYIENEDKPFEEWVVRGTPTEQALLLAAAQAGVSQKNLARAYKQIQFLPFNSQIKFAAGLYEVKGKDRALLFALGAPEEILKQVKWLDVNGKKHAVGVKERKQLEDKLVSFASQGLRVIACSYREYELREQTIHRPIQDLLHQMVFVGFIALKDPVRQDVAHSLKVTQGAGIRTIIITGDHKLTTLRTVGELGLSFSEEEVMEGKDIEELSDGALKKVVRRIGVFARVSPEHKLRIVNALKAHKEIVAMIGDGVNDAPALKAANVGISVGAGTDVAKEVSDMVLLDNSFSTLTRAIEQGRLVFENIRKLIIYLVSDDFSELFLFFGAIIMGLPLPLLPVQILWINVIEDGFPSSALASGKDVTGLMLRPPRKPREPIFHKPLQYWAISIFFITGIAALGTFWLLYNTTADIDYTRTVVFVLMAFDSLVFAFSCRSLKRSIFRKNLVGNRLLVGAVVVGGLLLLGAVYLPFLSGLLGTVHLDLYDWSFIALIALLELGLIEFTKYVFLIRDPAA